MTLAEPATSVSLRNILFATDLSSASETALQYARAIAQQYGAQLHSLHVSGEYSYQLLEPEPLAITFRDLPDAAQRPTETLRQLFSGLPTQAPRRSGQVWEVVNEIIARREIDLLVLGTHGRTGLDKMLNGSIAEDVFRNVACPVLTIGPDVKFDELHPLAFQQVLLATDFDRHTAAPAYAAWLCNDFHAKLTVLHVVHDKTREQLEAMKPAEMNVWYHPDPPAPPDLNSKPSAPPAEQLQALLPADLWCKPDLLVEYGQPAAKIFEVASRIRPDLIVLGARHPDPAKVNSHLPWTISGKVIAEAECPVLTVRQQE